MSNTMRPSWTEALLKRPLVEIRRGFSLGYEPAAEESSVLVLTAPSGKFVDIRFPLSLEADTAVKQESKHFRGYATAGLSTSSIAQGTGDCPPYECMVHVTWEHAIDSSGSFDTDGADMYLLANGAFMEIGTMEIRGEMKMFKEYWVQAKLGLENPPFWVMETKSAETRGSRSGMAIRIANFCQAILQGKDELWVERWETNEHGEWHRDSRSNTTTTQNHVVPCLWLGEASRKSGERITLGDLEWEVIETSET